MPCRSHFLLLLLAGVSFFLPAREFFAQPPSDESLSWHMGAKSGTNHYEPGLWSIVAVEVKNGRSTPASVMAVGYVDGDSEQQFARSLWVPPNSIRRSWFPIKPSGTIPANAQQFELKTMLREGEHLVASRSGQMLGSSLIPIVHEPATTGLFSRVGSPYDVDMIYETVIAFRFAVQSSRRLALISGDSFPPFAESLQGLDQLVVADDRLAADSAGTIALRRWLHSGGRLWLMLDQLEPSTVSALLGDSLDFQEVDRTSLTSVTVESREAGESDAPPATREFEEPVPFVRVIAPNAEVAHTVDGWPASFWQDIGQGKVLVTTLGPRGWVRPREPRDPQSAGTAPNTNFYAMLPMQQLSGPFFAPKQSAPPAAEQLRPYLNEQIGYTIVRRSSVLIVLIAFCLALPIGGIWLWHRGVPERTAIFAPIAALLVSGLLVGMGAAKKRAVEPTIAVVQFVEAVPGANDISISGVTAIYNQEAASAVIGSTGGGLLQPDLTATGGIRRIVWTGLDAWHWENLSFPAGVRLATSSYGVQIDKPIEAVASFGPEGLQGKVDAAPFTELSDVVIVVPKNPGLAVGLAGDGSFDARPSDMLAPGQFVAGTLLADEQRRRQAVYQQLFSGGSKKRIVGPRLLVWAQPLETKFDFGGDYQRVGSALLSMPLRIEKTPPDQDVTVPSSFVQMSPTLGPKGQRASSLYNNRTSEWVTFQRPAEAWLRFQLPQEVLPLELKRATLQIQMNAAAWQVNIDRLADGKVFFVAETPNPYGRLDFALHESGTVKLDDEGGIVVGIKLTKLDEQNSRLDGQIDFVRLEVSGRTLQP